MKQAKIQLGLSWGRFCPHPETSGEILGRQDALEGISEHPGENAHLPLPNQYGQSLVLSLLVRCPQIPKFSVVPWHFRELLGPGFLPSLNTRGRLSSGLWLPCPTCRGEDTSGRRKSPLESHQRTRFHRTAHPEAGGCNQPGVEELESTIAVYCTRTDSFLVTP
jgi:hypothetical protein